MTLWRDDRGVLIAVRGGLLECREEDAELAKLIPHLEEACR